MSDVRFLTAPGSFFTLIDKPGETYPGISWSEIVKLVQTPQAKEKIDADFFIPSTYRAHDGRAHEAQREHGTFRALAIDIDKGNPSLDDVQEAVQAVCGDVSMLIYSSSGASAENRKWRAIIPLAGIISGAEYEIVQTAFFDLPHVNGIHPDGALARCGQPIYLPNVPLAKRWPDLQPLFYQHRILRGKSLRQDERRTQVGLDMPVPAFARCRREIVMLEDRRVVDQHRQRTAKCLGRLSDKPLNLRLD